MSCVFVTFCFFCTGYYNQMQSQSQNQNMEVLVSGTVGISWREKPVSGIAVESFLEKLQKTWEFHLTVKHNKPTHVISSKVCKIQLFLSTFTVFQSLLKFTDHDRPLLSFITGVGVRQRKKQIKEEQVGRQTTKRRKERGIRGLGGVLWLPRDNPHRHQGGNSLHL